MTKADINISLCCEYATRARRSLPVFRAIYRVGLPIGAITRAGLNFLLIAFSWVLVFCACCFPLSYAAENGLSASDAYRAVKAGELVLIDVRSPEEWRRTGVPEGALTITIHQPRGDQAFYQAVLRAVSGDRFQPVGVICAAGARSYRAFRILEASGFENVRDISEGIEGSPSGPGWRERRLPIVGYD